MRWVILVVAAPVLVVTQTVLVAVGVAYWVPALVADLVFAVAFALALRGRYPRSMEPQTAGLALVPLRWSTALYAVGIALGAVSLAV